MQTAKDMKKILKSIKEKCLVTYKGTSMKLIVDFSSETMEAKMTVI